MIDATRLLMIAKLRLTGAMMTMVIVASATANPGAAQEGGLPPELEALAKNFKENKNVEKMLSALESYIEKHPGDSAAYMMAGRIFDQSGYGSLADDMFKAADQCNPGQAEVLLEQFRKALSTGGVKAAYPLLRYIQKRFPNDPEVLRSQGLLEALEGHHKAAEYFFLEALEANPKIPGPRTLLAGIYTKLGQYRQAEAYLKDELSIAPDYPAALVALSQLYLTRHQPAKAVPYMEQCYRMSNQFDRLGTRKETADLLAKTYISLGKPADALEPTLTALALTSTRDAPEMLAEKLRLRLILPSVSDERLLATVASVGEKLTERAARGTLLTATGDVCATAQRYAVAEKLFTEGIPVVAGHSRPLLRLAMLQLRRRDYQAGEESLSRAVALTRPDRQASAAFSRMEARTRNRNRDLCWQIKDALCGMETAPTVLEVPLPEQ